MSDATFEGPGPAAVARQRMLAGELALQHCRACGRFVAQPVVLCPSCGAAALEWRTASGRGTVHAVTIVRTGPGKDAPYCVALIDLAEGPRVMSGIAGLPPDQVSIGLEVVAEIAASEEGEPFHLFRPADARA